MSFHGKYIYNIFSIGWRPRGDSSRWFGGIGLGGHIPIRRLFVDIDALSHGVYTEPRGFEDGGTDLLSSLRISVGWQAMKWLAITAGPTASVWVSEHEDGSAVPYYDAPLLEWHGAENVRIWPGFTAGIQLF